MLFRPEDYTFTFDLKSGYHHLNVFSEHWQYLGFAWSDGPVTKTYTFLVLPFGLCTARYGFTKLMHPLIMLWQGRDLRVVVYFDDDIMVIEGLEQALATSCSVQVDMANAGFVIDTGNLQLEPVISAAWLGFNINLAQGQIQEHDIKLQALKQELDHMIGCKTIPS